MGIIHVLAETLNFFTIHVFLLLQKFFHLNFTFVSFIVKCIQDLKETVLEYIIPILNILQCYYQDLIIFLYEVFEIIHFLVTTTSSILHSICIKIIDIINNFTDLLQTVYQNIIIFFTSVQNSALQACDLTIYFIQLIFNSLLLILQLIPNLLILLFDIFKICFYYLLDFLSNSAASVTENIFYVSSRCSEAIYNIPVKAYIGALLLAVLFHQYKIVLKYLKAYFALLVLFLFEIGNYIIHVAFFCLKPVVVMSVTAFNISKRILYLKETQTANEDGPHFSGEQNPQIVQCNIFHRYSSRIKIFFKKYLIKGKYAEEQIEQLQKELLAEREKHTCIICFDRPRSIIIHPCRHMCICDECSANWYTDLRRCPLCRQTIFDVYSVYT